MHWKSGSVGQNIEIHILSAALSFQISPCELINPVLHSKTPRPSMLGTAGVLLLCLLHLFCLVGARAFQSSKGTNSQALSIDPPGILKLLPFWHAWPCDPGRLHLSTIERVILFSSPPKFLLINLPLLLSIQKPAQNPIGETVIPRDNTGTFADKCLAPLSKHVYDHCPANNLWVTLLWLLVEIAWWKWSSSKKDDDDAKDMEELPERFFE